MPSWKLWEKTLSIAHLRLPFISLKLSFSIALTAGPLSSVRSNSSSTLGARIISFSQELSVCLARSIREFETCRLCRSGKNWKCCWEWQKERRRLIVKYEILRFCKCLVFSLPFSNYKLISILKKKFSTLWKLQSCTVIRWYVTIMITFCLFGRVMASWITLQWLNVHFKILGRYWNCQQFECVQSPLYLGVLLTFCFPHCALISVILFCFVQNRKTLGVSMVRCNLSRETIVVEKGNIIRLLRQLEKSFCVHRELKLQKEKPFPTFWKLISFCF